ncbi:MAG: dephospho-CoA kinase [Crocinitomicaceae bacterium]|nr:dephospho-CoA kinase [Crocinitomicaceae bacterium]MDG1776473.1 dephospho-CoA kinase [Crocinitomicaceae bacterium]
MKVGITGGIGSGKSIVSELIKTMGYRVFNSDAISKQLVNEDPVIVDGLTALFGEEIYCNNQLNKELLAKIIFSDDAARLSVNKLIHPRVRNAFDLFASKQTNGISFNEAAILFETGADKNFDKVILVTSPKALKISRIIYRDNCSKENVEVRMSKQWTDDQKIPLADFVVINDEKMPLISQVEAIVNQLTSV